MLVFVFEGGYEGFEVRHNAVPTSPVQRFAVRIFQFDVGVNPVRQTLHTPVVSIANLCLFGIARRIPGGAASFGVRPEFLQHFEAYHALILPRPPRASDSPLTTC